MIIRPAQIILQSAVIESNNDLQGTVVHNLMKRASKILVALAVVLICGTGWCVYDFLLTWTRIPEAYAAWDTGTLLVEYMKRHQDQWPTSWDDLIEMLDPNDGRIQLRGGEAGDLEYARSLREKVSVNWEFDPSRPDAAVAVTPPGGGDFPVVWEGGEPNQMVRSYLMRRATSHVP